MYRVLIVDDEPFILDGLFHIIQWEEYGAEIVAKAANGIEALNLIENMNIDILITDIKMPEMDGLELLQNIRKLELNPKIIILSGYDDFKLVKEAARLGIENYLLKPIEEDELSATLLNTIDKLENEMRTKIRIQESYNFLRENILYRWVTNNISDEELKNRAEFLNLNLNANYYMVSIVRLLKRSIQDSYDTNPGNLLFDIRNIVSKELEDYGNNIMFATVQGDLVILFSWENEEVDFKSAVHLLNQCMINIKRNTQNDVFITIGPAVSGYQQTYLSYNKAFKLLDYQLVMPRSSIVNFESISKNSFETTSMFKIDFEKFKRILAAKDKEAALQFIEDIYAKLRTMEGITPEYVRNLTLEILLNILSTFNNQNMFQIHKHNFSNLSDDTLSEILNSHDLSEVSAQLKSIIEESISKNDSLRQDSNPFIISLLQYIDKNYAQEMSLKTLSIKFKVNAAYLGQLFKNSTGELFSNYLNRIRIDKAKGMLAGTNMKIGDIAAKVGYNNVNYFSNLFKKMTGVYPTEYKKNHI